MMQNEDYESTIDKTDGNGVAPATMQRPGSSIRSLCLHNAIAAAGSSRVT